MNSNWSREEWMAQEIESVSHGNWFIRTSDVDVERIEPTLVNGQMAEVPGWRAIGSDGSVISEGLVGPGCVIRHKQSEPFKFFYGPGGSLLCDEPHSAAVKLTPPETAIYGHPYMVGETMALASAQWLVQKIGGVLVDDAP